MCVYVYARAHMWMCVQVYIYVYMHVEVGETGCCSLGNCPPSIETESLNGLEFESGFYQVA